MLKCKVECSLQASQIGPLEGSSFLQTLNLASANRTQSHIHSNWLTQWIYRGFTCEYIQSQCPKTKHLFFMPTLPSRGSLSTSVSASVSRTLILYLQSSTSSIFTDHLLHHKTCNSCTINQSRRVLNKTHDECSARSKWMRHWQVEEMGQASLYNDHSRARLLRPAAG